MSKSRIAMKKLKLYFRDQKYVNLTESEIFCTNSVLNKKGYIMYELIMILYFYQNWANTLGFKITENFENFKQENVFLRIILVEDNEDLDEEDASLPEKSEIFGKKNILLQQ